MTREDEALAELREILDGIDSDDHERGWWETSFGADFGAGKLAEVLAWGQRALGVPVADHHEHRWVDHGFAEPDRPDIRYRCRCGLQVRELID